LKYFCELSDLDRMQDNGQGVLVDVHTKEAAAAAAAAGWLPALW
jgi:hypothetical protein